MATQAYRVLKASKLEPLATVGTIVFARGGYDYGCASDDTRATGVEHVSVTLKRSGGIPGFTIPLRDLEAAEAEPLPKLTEEHVTSVCRPCAGAETCRYIGMGAGGWTCIKHSSAADTIDSRVEKNDFTARGNNCEGRE